MIGYAMPLRLILAFFLAQMAGAVPAGLGIVKVLDSNTPLPGATNATGGFSKVSWDGSVVAFIGYQYPFERYALFRVDNGVVERVATSFETTLPGDQGRIFIAGTSDDLPAVAQGKVWLEVGLTNSVATRGVIESDDGGLRLVMSNVATDALLGEEGSWFSGNGARHSGGGRIVRMIHGNLKQWLVAYDGSGLDIINDAPGLLPSEMYPASKWAVYPEGFTVWKPNSQVRFLRQHLGVTQVIDSNFLSLFPNSKVVSIDGVYANGKWVVVQTRDSELGYIRYSLHGWSAGNWFPLAVPGNELVDGRVLGDFSDTSSHSIDGNSLLVEARIAGAKTIVLCRNGGLFPMVGVGDQIDGGTVIGLSIYRYSLVGNRFVFIALFQGGRSGIYTADFSAVAPDTGGRIESDFFPGTGKRGLLEIDGVQDHVYHLHRSLDLKSSVVAESKQGANGRLQFEFDDSAGNVDRCFYWIEGARYSHAP